VHVIFFTYLLTNTNVDNGASANLEFMHKFCYLGDMLLSVDGDADAVVEARI